MDSISMNNWVIDLSDSNKETKEAFLLAHANKNVLMDLSCFDPQEFYQRFPQLKAVCSTLLSHNQVCEVHLRTEDQTPLELLIEKGFKPVEINFTTPGFIVARTIATIANEAFFALEEKVATENDIDRAMKFGVNYPVGPFRWVRGKEAVVVKILDLLKGLTGDSRYDTAKLLRARATN